LTERKKNPQTKANYYYLLDDADVKRERLGQMENL